MAQKRSLSKITDFMTGSSRKEREEGDVDCVPPPPKCSCHRGTFDPKDKLRDHERSRCHADAVQAEAIAAAAKRSGGIAACLEEQVSLPRQAV